MIIVIFSVIIYAFLKRQKNFKYGIFYFGNNHKFSKKRGERLEIKRIELELARWKKSIKRKIMLDGERYYRGEHDILKRKRTVIGKNGKLEEVQNLPNNKIVDNQYAKMVDQKVNYLMGKPLTFDTEDESY